jgi:phosphopantetheine attachment domain protein
MNIHETLNDVLDELGVVVGDDGQFSDLDSIAFITMIIRVEETFDIVIPDDFLNLSSISTVQNFEIIIRNLLAKEL